MRTNSLNRCLAVNVSHFTASYHIFWWKFVILFLDGTEQKNAGVQGFWCLFCRYERKNHGVFYSFSHFYVILFRLFSFINKEHTSDFSHVITWTMTVWRVESQLRKTFYVFIFFRSKMHGICVLRGVPS